MKGLHTQGVAVLFRALPPDEALAAVLAAFDATARPAKGDSPWVGARGWTLPYEAGGKGVAVVAPIAARWPDAMGEPDGDARLFGAWSMGFFGPFAYPGGLERAGIHDYLWGGGKAAVAEHTAFVRITTTFVMGATPDTPVVPPGYAPDRELDFVLRVAMAVAALPGAVAFFDPNGEVLLPAGGLASRLAAAAARDLPPIDVWTNVRMFVLDDVAPWMVMDTVGMAQLDRRDLEACFPGPSFDRDEVAGSLRDVSLHLLKHGDVFADGDTLDGAGGRRWRIRVTEDSVLEPPRSTYRIFPADLPDVPEPLRKGIATWDAVKPPASKKGFWRRLFGG